MSNMNPGDKVWYFDHRLELITESEIVVVENVDDNLFYSVYDYYRAAASTKILPEQFMPTLRISQDKVFPTREALCEHYRKIFE